MYLHGKSPIRMAFHSLYTDLHIGFPLFFVFHKTRLQETAFGLYIIILPQILTEIDHFKFVAYLQHARFRITSFKNCLGRKCHPVEVIGQKARAISLNGNLLTCLLLQFRHKGLVNEQGRLASCQHNQRSYRIFVDFNHNFLQRHHCAALVLRVAKGTAQVAAAETHEDGSRTAVVAFALEGMEYFVDLIHNNFQALRQAQGPEVVEPVETPRQSIKVLRSVVLDVGGFIVA